MTYSKRKPCQHAGQRTTCFVLLLGLACLLGVGCTDSSTATKSGGEEEHHHHDHGHRPASYNAALAQIKHARDEVKAAFDAGTPNECDDALHDVAEVLGVLPEVAAETDLPKEDWQVVKDQSKVLFDQFMKIHDGFHGDSSQGASFESVAAEINAAIEVLESKVSATGEKVSPASDKHHDEHDGHDHGDHDGHDHDGHDHGDHDHEEHDAGDHGDHDH